MSLHKDLLDQAGHLAKREPKRPKQASLRRAVSASYYAVFHLLIDAASRFVVRGNNRAGLRHAVTRAFDHGEMKSAANTFKGGTLPSVMQTAVQAPVPAVVVAAVSDCVGVFVLLVGIDDEGAVVPGIRPSVVVDVGVHFGRVGFEREDYNAAP